MTFMDHLKARNVKIAYTFIGERWSMLATGHLISFDDLDLQEPRRLIWRHELVIPARAGLPVLWNILLTWYMKLDIQKQKKK